VRQRGGQAALAISALAALSLPPVARPAPVLLPRLAHGSNYGESFTFVADLADGTYVQVSLSFTNLGPGPTKGICRAVVASAGRPAWKASERVGRKEWSYQATPEERLGVGTCSVTHGQSATLVQADLEGGRVRLSIAAPLESQVPPGALVTVGPDHYRTEILLYRAPVEAAIALPGQAARSVSGFAYADHSRSTVQPKDLAARWIRFRGLRGDRGLLVLGRESHENEFGPLWSYDQSGRWQEYATFRLERSGTADAPAFRIHVLGGNGGIEIRSGALLLRDAPVEELGLLGKMVGPFVGSPVTYVYRARASKNGGPEIEGILEVELVGE
jgi:hypothetical protein